jgi:hypothetical protein
MGGEVMATLYKTNGIHKEVLPRNGKVFELEELQAIVGGSIEVVRSVDGKKMIINEEGKLKKMDLNVLATLIYQHGRHDPIVGPALVVERGEIN